ncbi:Protein SIEVE ELEMENT OCCLUSION B [Glycine max]|nr:Protein SIEVE ELEMENT OCCLUSION B [Glycine max]
MTKHIRATHAPVHGHIDVRPLFHVVVDIFHRSLSHPWLALFRYMCGKQGQMDAMKSSAYQSDLANVLDISYHAINKIFLRGFLIPNNKSSLTILIPYLPLYFASVLSGGDVHATTMGILGMLSSYSWDAKVVIALAANFKEFWLVAQLHATNRLAKSVAKLKHIHETL